MAHNIFIECVKCKLKYPVRMRVYTNPQPFEINCTCGQYIRGLMHYTPWMDVILKGGKMEARYEGEGFELLKVDIENIEGDFKFINLDEYYSG